MKAKPRGFVVTQLHPTDCFSAVGPLAGPLLGEQRGPGLDKGPGQGGCPVTARRVMSHSFVSREAL